MIYSRFGMEIRSKGILFALAGTLLMSLDAVFVRLSGMSGWNTSFLFGSFSLIAMTFFTWKKEGLANVFKNGWAVIILSGIIMGGSGTNFVLAVKNTAVANVVLIMSAVPLFSALLSMVFLKERPSGKTWLAIAFTMIGIFTIVQGSLRYGGIKGDLLALATTIFVSLNYVVWRKYPKVSRSMCVGAGGFFIALFSSFGMTSSDMNLRGILVMAVMGLLTAPFGRTYISTAARYITATEIGLYSLLKIMITPAIVWAIYGEIPPSATFYGGLILLATISWHMLYKK